MRAFLERSLATIEHALASSETGGADDDDELAEASKKKKAPKLLQWRPDVDKAAIDEVNECERFRATGTAEEKRAAYELAAKAGDVVSYHDDASLLARISALASTRTSVRSRRSRE